jgi:hypothetical protein
LVDDIIVVVKSSNTNEVQAGICPRDIRAAKRRAEVSPAIFMSAIPLSQPLNFCVSDIFVC